MTSYPRSGNTLLRTYLEKVSHIYTGSDCDLKRPLNMQLKTMGLSGEGCLNNTVWVVKTHYPERIGRVTFFANKCIVVVRNPLDSIFSLFNMVGTISHNESLSQEVLQKACEETELWTDFIRQETTVWEDFHDYWVERSREIPVHFIKYESLLLEPETALTDLFKFLLDKESLEGLTIAERISKACNEGMSQSQTNQDTSATQTQVKQHVVYKPRSGKINKNIHRFTEMQLSFLYNKCSKHILHFDYLSFF